VPGRAVGNGIARNLLHEAKGFEDHVGERRQLIIHLLKELHCPTKLCDHLIAALTGYEGRCPLAELTMCQKIPQPHGPYKLVVEMG
jgi:hypothetical protein